MIFLGSVWISLCHELFYNNVKELQFKKCEDIFTVVPALVTLMNLQYSLIFWTYKRAIQYIVYSSDRVLL